MSALGHYRTLTRVDLMSALLPKVVQRDRDVRFVPKAEAGPLAIFRGHQPLREQELTRRRNRQNVSTDTVARFERGDELKRRTIDALQLAFEAAGVEFTNGDQPGVRLTKGATTPRRALRPAVAPKQGRSKKGRGK
jgi:hypothetical protein